MFSPHTRRREVPAVTAGSMADIAFLLLIFFLVTTKIEEDQGVLVRLPPYSEEDIVVESSEVFNVMLNTVGELMVEGERTSVVELPLALREYVLSPNRKPSQAVVSLAHDRGTPYGAYLEVYDALLAGYRTMWDEEARRRYGSAYADLSPSRQKEVRAGIPMVISEAEPSDLLTGT